MNGSASPGAAETAPRQWRLPWPPLPLVPPPVPDELESTIVIGADALFPPASQAVIVIEFVPEASGTETLHEAAPGTVPC